jgi:hypothetical protein
MNLEAVSGALTIAMFSSLLFVVIATAWLSLNRTLSSGNRFSGSIMFEAAQRFRDQFDSLTRLQSIYLASALVFLVIFLTAYLLGPDRIFEDLPKWQLIALLGAVSLLGS